MERATYEEIEKERGEHMSISWGERNICIMYTTGSTLETSSKIAKQQQLESALTDESA